MTILALETSTLTASVAVVRAHAGRGVVAAMRRARVTTHSEMLLSLVAEALAEAGLAGPAALDAVACGAGPGSFTGLRIGLATAKGLCLAAERPLVLVSSLQALAHRAPGGCLALAALDAFKGEVYAGFYRASDEPRAESPEAVLPPAALLPQLAEAVRREPVHLVGDAAARWPELVIPGVDATDRGPPDAVDVALLASRRLARGEQDDLAAAVPTYIRPSEAELGPLGRLLRSGD